MNINKMILYFAIAAQLSNACAPAEDDAEIVEMNLSNSTKNPLIEEWFSTIAVKVGEKTFTAYVQYTHGRESCTGTVKKLYVTEEIRKKGYGERLLKHGIVKLYAYQPRVIEWDAEPLENYNDIECLRSLERFYRGIGGVKVSESKLVVSSGFEYPMQLAASLAILNPILSQQQLPRLKKPVQTDPWKVVVSYLRPEDFGYEKEKDDCYKLVKKKYNL
jgi:GNAT superfamily N-acetyltransferase